MHFEELKIMTNDKRFVIDVIEKRLIEKNVSYVRLDYEGYTEFHFLDYIYRLMFLDLENEKSGKYEVLNKMMNSVNKGILNLSPDSMPCSLFEDDFQINMMNYDNTLEEKRMGYKKYRPNQDKNFSKQKVNVKSKFTNKFYKRG